MTKGDKQKKVKVTKTKDGRFFAEYFEKGNLLLNGIGQFGSTAYEARINLKALITAVNRQANRPVNTIFNL